MVDGGVVGILADVLYGLPNLIGGPSAATVTNLADTTIKTVWNPAQAKDAIAQITTKEAPALRQAQALLDKVDSKFNDKNITQEYYKARRKAFEWAAKKKSPTLTDKTKKVIVQSITGWIKNAPQERTLSYEMAVRQILVGDIDDAADHLFFLMKTADNDDELLSIEKGITSALDRAAPLGPVSVNDYRDFKKTLSNEQKKSVFKLERKWDKNSRKAQDLADDKYDKWEREQRRKKRRR